MEVGMEIEIITEGLHGGNGAELSVGQLKPRAHPVAEALDGGAEEMIQELAPLAEDASQGFRHRKHELPVQHLEAGTRAIQPPVERTFR